MIRKKIKKMLVCSLALLLMLLAVGCGASKSADKMSSSSMADRGNMSNAMATPSAEAAPLEQLESKEDSKAIAEEPKGEAANDSAAVKSGGAPEFQSGMGSELGVESNGFSRKLIYRANLTMEVSDYAKAQTALQNQVKLAGGYILQFSDQKSAYELGGTFTIKVPAKGFMNFIGQLEKIDHKEFQRQLEGHDVTEEYVDLKARLTAKQVVEKRLLTFMEKASNADDLVQFSTELGNVQEEIERIKGRMRYLDQNVEFSTVELRLYQVIEPVENTKNVKDKSFSDRISRTMSKSWEWFVAFFQGAFLVLVAIVPVLILAIAIGVPLFIYLRKRKRSKQHKPESPDI